MKYTDKFFKFPIRIYDGLEMLKAEIDEEKKLEEEDPDLTPVPIEFLVGRKAVRIDDIIGYNETMDREHDKQEVREQGFPCTIVEIKDQGPYFCNWTFKKFEEKLNEFCENLPSE